MLHHESGETLQQVSQRSRGCLISGVFKAMLEGLLSDLSSGKCPCPWQGGGN